MINNNNNNNNNNNKDKLRVIRMLKTKLLNRTITKYSEEERIMLINRLTKQEEENDSSK